MIKKILALSVVAILGTWASTAVAGPGRDSATQCYVWANNATPAVGVGYHPSPDYSFNAYGDAATYNTVYRTGTGTYRVACKGAGGSGWGVAGGHVQVTAYGPTNSYCKVQNWDSGGVDFQGYVRCYNAAGALVNSQFDLMYVW